MSEDKRLIRFRSYFEKINAGEILMYCEICKKQIKRKHPEQKYCIICSKKIMKENRNKYYRKKQQKEKRVKQALVDNFIRKYCIIGSNLKSRINHIKTLFDSYLDEKQEILEKLSTSTILFTYYRKDISSNKGLYKGIALKRRSKILLGLIPNINKEQATPSNTCKAMSCEPTQEIIEQIGYKLFSFSFLSFLPYPLSYVSPCISHAIKLCISYVRNNCGKSIHPSSLAAACLWYSYRLNNNPKTQEEISSHAEISITSLRKYYRKIDRIEEGLFK